MSTVLKFAILLLTPLSWVNGAPDFDVEEILDWKVPEHLQKNFPYYLSGYDYEGSPVFVVEFGKWDLRGEIEAGPEATEQLDMLFTQMLLRWRRTGAEAPGSPGSLVIADLEGFGVRQAGHFGVVQFLLRQFPKFEKIAREPGLKKIMAINTNFLVERIFETGRPLLGQVADIIELHGSPARWKPLLLKEVPADQLPAWYGGSKSHQVIKVYGG